MISILVLTQEGLDARSGMVGADGIKYNIRKDLK